MIDYKAIFLYFENWLQIIAWFVHAKLMTNIAKDMEILALRSQLAIAQQKILNGKMPKPRFTIAFYMICI